MQVFIDLIKPLLDKIKLFWEINHKQILLFIFLFFCFYFTIKTYLISSNKSNEIVENNPIVANYRSDMNFIECIAEQHSCVYTNLTNKIDHQKIIEACKNENFCSNPIIVRTPK